MSISELSVLTLNAWLLKLPCGLELAADLAGRFHLLPQAIAQLDADIVCLQENWHPALRRTLAERLHDRGYRYSAGDAGTFPSILDTDRPLTKHLRKKPDRVTHCLNRMGQLSEKVRGILREQMGHGLQIFSRYPIAAEPLHYAFSHFTRTDEQFVRKGALKADIRLPNGLVVEVYNTHVGAVTFHAEESRFCSNEEEARYSQVEELIQWIQSTRRSESVVLAGDLNTHTHEYRSGTYGKDLSHEFASIISPAPYGLGFIDTFTYANGIREDGVTDCRSNPYKARGHFKNSPDGVLDYIFSSPKQTLSVQKSQVVMRERPCISDHYGVLTSFAVG